VRAAIVHDWFQGYYGAERAVDAIFEVLGQMTQAPVDIHTFSATKDSLPPALAQSIVRESRLANLPLIRSRDGSSGRWRYLLPYMPRYFDRLDLEPYDVVVSSSHACAAGVRTREDASHVCYCYTPMRYVWLADAERDRVSGLAAAGLGLFRSRLRRFDLAASRRPDTYVAISQAVRERIQRIYGRDAVVIHPPVDVEGLRVDRERESDHFLWVQRLVAYKQPIVVAEAFRQLPYRLTMVGIGPLEAKLREVMPPNVELYGWLDRPELVTLFSRAAGFVHIGEEDFGIAMVEALAAGVPVIALRRGGALDIVRDGIDGILIDEPTSEAVRTAVREVASRDWDSAALAERAASFAPARFAERFRAHLEEVVRAA
jgi:glycosyltransferase involved in cell wall biosynthesis